MKRLSPLGDHVSLNRSQDVASLWRRKLKLNEGGLALHAPNRYTHERDGYDVNDLTQRCLRRASASPCNNKTWIGFSLDQRALPLSPLSDQMCRKNREE